MASRTPAARGGRAAEPTFTRSALAPGLLVAVVLMATVGLLDSTTYIIVRFAVTILTVVIAYYAIKSSKLWWLVGLVPIIVFYNPIFPLPTWPVVIEPVLILWITLVAPLFLVACGVFLRVPVETPPASSRR